MISGADRSGINFVLDPILSGGRISGQVKDSAEIPLPDVLVVFKNMDGFFLFELWTDAGGNYQTELMSDDSYFIHTLIEPVGLGRELYDDIPCLPADACHDPAYVKANGTPVTVDSAALVGHPLDEERLEAFAAKANRPAKPLDNTDFNLSWRKRVCAEYIKGALRELRGDDPASMGVLARHAARLLPVT